MPYKLKNDRRHKFDKPKYKVRNWREYEQGLVNRGSLTIWFSEDAVTAWKPVIEEKKRGGQPEYSDLAIQTITTLRKVYHLGLRQAEGFVKSIIQLLELDLATPDHSTLSRRSASIKLELPKRKNGEPVVVIIDSTGLKISGTGEWCVEKHGTRKRRSWRKLHIAINESTGEILSSELTTNDVGDPTMLPDLLNGIDEKIDAVMADGAYDSTDYNKIDNSILPLIPPPKDAVLSSNFEVEPSTRDSHILLIDSLGREAWQRETGYTKRSLVENTMYRYKKIIGGTMQARKLSAQQTEAKIGCMILNQMNSLGMPDSYRV
jgi:hypothetical protein